MISSAHALRIALAASGALVACATQQPGAQRYANVNLNGYPPAFKDGYADGCASAGAGRVRNDARFKSDSQYAQGWRDGFDICGPRTR